MPTSKPTLDYPPKRTAPLQYFFQSLNDKAGLVAPGWGTAPLMALIILLFFVFLLIMLQIFNQSIRLDGVVVNWAATADLPANSASTVAQQAFTTTATGVFAGLLALAFGCGAFIAYGAFTYPQKPE